MLQSPEREASDMHKWLVLFEATQYGMEKKKKEKEGGRERGINNINFELLTVMSVCNSELYTKVLP